MSEEEQQEPEVLTPGKMLRQARIDAGLSPEQIAEKLRLKVASIHDLEQDHYDNDISITFTKGYIKLYAKQVGVSEAAVLDAFETLNTQNKEPAKLQSFSRRVARQASDDRLMLVTWLIVIVVVALVVLWWWQQSDSDNTGSLLDLPSLSSQESEVGTQDEPAEPTDAVDQQPMVQVASEAVDLATLDNEAPTEELAESDPPVEEVEELAAVASDVTVDAPSDEFVDPPSDEALSEEVPTEEIPAVSASAESLVTESVATDTVELILEFSGDCWINVVDATGEAKAFGIKEQGHVSTISGVSPFEVTLGAPEVVQISYNGEPVDMSRFRSGRTAKFYLPLTN